MKATSEQERLLRFLDKTAHKPIGKSGRVTFNLWWTQQGRQEIEAAFADLPTVREEVLAIGRELAAGRA